jgi:hypothetical protein
MHPDQMYELRQLRHSDLRMETEQTWIRRELTSSRAAWGCGWLAPWLRRLSTHWTHTLSLAGLAGSNTRSRTI